MEYFIDKNKLKRRIVELGYESISQFARNKRIHRSTLVKLLKGGPVILPSVRKIAKGLQIDPLDLFLPVSPLPASIPLAEEIGPIVARLVKKNRKMAVVLLGSRAAGKGRPYSDWDLGIFSIQSPISGLESLRLKRQVGEMSENLVREVDLINLNQAPVWFLENLEILFLDGDKESFFYLKGLIDGIQKEKQAA